MYTKMAKKKKFFVSTALDYVNASPHLGHALEKAQADVIARYHRFLGDEVFFLSGTDDNSLKNVRVAKREGVAVKKLVDRNSRKFYQLKDALNLSFDDFIRTTEERHIKGAQKLWLACEKDIYKKKYKGLYCVGCEQFYKEKELENGLCPEHKTRPELVEEENYFFHLARYQKKLKKIIETNKIKIIPQSRKNETLSFINQGLEDICISRSAERAQGWGIDVPGDASQKIWVWFDALSNYINALGYAEKSLNFQEWWTENKDKLHIVGKGILRFHAIYWPAFLLSAKLPLPKTIFVHGYITSGGQKMSKSLGNVIDPFELVEKYGTDAARYFLLQEISPTEDGDYTQEKFEERYNADLANGLGNLVARVIALRVKLKIHPVKCRSAAISSKTKLFNRAKIKKEINKTQREYRKALDDFKFNEALKEIWKLISFCDKYIEEERPWEIENTKHKTKNKKVIEDLLFALSVIAQMLKPFLPETSEKIIQQLKTRRKGEILFPRI